MKDRQVKVEYFQRIIDGESFGEVNKDLLVDGRSYESFSYCPAFVDNQKYTWKPKTVTIEIPEPMRVKPEFESIYFFRDASSREGFRSSVWYTDLSDENRFVNGIWGTEEKMKQVIAADRGAVK